MQKINLTGGNDWFWAPDIGNIMTTSVIVDGHLKRIEPLWANFLLNCPPNRDGLLPPEIVSRLGEVGAAWAPDASRPPLPAQPPQIDIPYDPVTATATGGPSTYAVDGKDDWYYYSVWEPPGALPQAITVDLGQERADVSVLIREVIGYLGVSHDGGQRRLARERPDEDRVVRSRRRALREAGSDRRQRADGRGDRDLRGSAAVSRSLWHQHVSR